MLEIIDTSGIVFRWGTAHQIGTVEIGLGRHSSFRAWSDLTSFERGTALEWALDVVQEYQT